MAKREFYNFQNNDFVHDASIFIPICLNDLFPNMFDTRLTSCTIVLLINVKFSSIEEFYSFCYYFLQDLYLCLSVKFVTDGHTVGRKWFTVGDLASWIFFMGVSLLITSGWILVAIITFS